MLKTTLTDFKLDICFESSLSINTAKVFILLAVEKDFSAVEVVAGLTNISLQIVIAFGINDSF